VWPLLAIATMTIYAEGASVVVLSARFRLRSRRDFWRAILFHLDPILFVDTNARLKRDAGLEGEGEDVRGGGGLERWGVKG